MKHPIPHTRRRLRLAIAAALALPWAAGAQTSPPAPEATCPDDPGEAVAATTPQPGQDGTSPGNSGSTGWSGGLGGSQIGTNTQGALPSSPASQAPTARGLDLGDRPGTAADASRPRAANATPGC